jgi:hypothetical protein
VREEIVRVAVLPDAHHLAADEGVLLDEKGGDTAFLQERCAGGASGATADDDDVILFFRHEFASVAGSRK